MEINFFPDKFTSGELYVIEKIWTDLTEKSNKKNIGISQEIFEVYTNISGLLGSRLFESFDSNANGHINLKDFIEGLEIICLGTPEKHATFLFKIFDIKKNHQITKNTMSIILNSIPHKFVCGNVEYFSYNKTQSEGNYEIWTNNCVCTKAFEIFDTNHHDYLEQDEFINWAKTDNILINYIKYSISYQIQTESKRKNSLTQSISLSTSILIDSTKSKTDILPKSSDSPNRFESEMYKIGKTTGHKIKRYYLLYGDSLYYYVSKNNIKPKGVIFLSGSVIKSIGENEFEILELNHCTGEFDNSRKKHLICLNKELRNKWITHLQKSSHIISFETVYTLGKKIGSGAFSEVYLCFRNSDSKKFAVKIISKINFANKDKINLKNEISILKLVSHPNIIHLDGFFETQTNIYFVIEYIEGGDLFSNIVQRPRFTDNELKTLAKVLAECLAYIHSLGIAHRDVKPENILCNKETNQLILTDFGLSQIVLPDSKLSDICGTLDYVAPEILNSIGYGIEADIWSLGIILYLVYYGNLPFVGIDDIESINNILTKEPNYSENKNYLANDLISKLLDKNIKTRITAKEILSHPFILLN